MKITEKISTKQKKILSISLIVFLLIILIITIIGLVKTIKSKNEIKEVSMEETIEGDYEEEINIEELEEVSEENEITSPKSENNNSTTSNKKYYIKVNYGANVVTIYAKDEEGNYTVPVRAMICSTGTSTPKSGKYGIKGRWRWLGLFGGVYGQYSTQIVGNILFHSVPYLEKGNAASLEYWEYDKLGTSCSMGCIRLTVRDAKWIYNNISSGTLVEFYSSSDPGPLGKPSAQKISGNIECRNWDPTDTAEGNPWNAITEKEVTEVNTNSKKNEVNTLTNTNNVKQNTTNNKVVNNVNNTTNNTKENVTNNNTNQNIGNVTNTTSQNNVNTTNTENKTNEVNNTNVNTNNNNNTANLTNTENQDIIEQ